MVGIEIWIDGRKVNPKQVKNALEKATLKRMQSRIAEKISDVRDPETGERPKVIMEGRSLSDLSLKVSGSESVIEEVKRRFS